RTGDLHIAGRGLCFSLRTRFHLEQRPSRSELDSVASANGKAALDPPVVHEGSEPAHVFELQTILIEVKNRVVRGYHRLSVRIERDLARRIAPDEHTRRKNFDTPLRSRSG